MRKLANCILPLVVIAIFSLMVPGVAEAQDGPPYDMTVSFDPPSSGPAPDSYNVYINDCAASGATAAPFAADMTSGQVFTNAITQNGSFEVCVRTVRTVEGENPDPGPVHLEVLGLSGPVENLSVIIN